MGFNSAEKGLDNEVTVWEFDEAGKQLHRSSLTLPDAAFAFLHDFAMTERHYIFLENPVRMNLGKLLTKYMFGKACIAECLQYDPSRPTKVHVLPRPERGAPPGSDGHRVYQTPSPFFSFHHANAFVSPDGHIVVDTVALHDGMDFSANLDIGATYYDDDVGRGTLTRLVLSPWSGGVAQHRMLARACEFPSVAPCQVGRPATHTYMVGARFDSERAWGPPEVVVKTSIDPGAGVGRALDAAREVTQRVYSPGEGRWAGEPIFVPRPVSEGVSSAEDDGWVLVMVFDSTTRKSELVILDARDMSVTATVKLPLMLPAGLHGSWTKEYLGFAPHTSFQPKKYDIRSGASKYE